MTENYYLSTEAELDNGYGWVKWCVQWTGIPHHIDSDKKIIFLDSGKSKNNDDFNYLVNNFEDKKEGSIITDIKSSIKDTDCKVEINDYLQAFILAQNMIGNEKYCFEKANFYKADLIFNLKDNLLDPIFTDVDNSRLITKAFVVGIYYFENKMNRFSFGSLSIDRRTSPYDLGYY